MEVNLEAWTLWHRLVTQQDRGLGSYGPLRYEAVRFIFELYEVTEPRETFEKIIMVHNIHMEIQESLKDD